MVPVVLITGASRGIGKVIALAFAKRHCRIGLNYLRCDDKAKETAKEIEKSGSEVLLLKANVGKVTQVKKMIARILKKWGRMDVLVNNAGITRDRTILKMNDMEWQEVLDVNLSGAFWCLRECAKIMVKQKEGAILNISSIVGMRGSIGNANYSAAKAGLIGLTKSAAKELGRFNVRVNAILPGFHLTDMGMEVWGEQAERIKAEHTLGRLTDIHELAEFVVFMALQKSASGQVFNFESRVI